MKSELVQSRETTGADEPHIVLHGVTWQQYVTLRSTLDEGFRSLRMTYCEGVLEIMPTSTEHERLKKIIARLIEMYAWVYGIALNGYGSATFQKEAAERGLEPDECYCFGEIGEVPDMALEIALSHGYIDKLDVYRGLGVPEVWFWRQGQFALYRLRGERYQTIERSELVPSLDFSLLARYVHMTDQLAALKAYHKAITSGEVDIPGDGEPAR